MVGWKGDSKTCYKNKSLLVKPVFAVRVTLQKWVTGSEVMLWHSPMLLDKCLTDLENVWYFFLLGFLINDERFYDHYVSISLTGLSMTQFLGTVDLVCRWVVWACTVCININPHVNPPSLLVRRKKSLIPAIIETTGRNHFMNEDIWSIHISTFFFLI